MHRHMEATKGHIRILEKKEAKESKIKKILGFETESMLHLPVFLPCLFDVPQKIKRNPLPRGRGHQ